MKQIEVPDLQIPEKYLPFLLEEEGIEGKIVRVTGMAEDKVHMEFSDGLKGSFGFDTESEDLKKALVCKGYFTVNPETGVVGTFHYDDTKPAKPQQKTTRQGSMAKRPDL